MKKTYEENWEKKENTDNVSYGKQEDKMEKKTKFAYYLEAKIDDVDITYEHIIAWIVEWEEKEHGA